MGNDRKCTPGDKVRIFSGPYEGRVGTVTHVRSPEDILFEGAQKSISASIIEEPYAVVNTRLVAEVDGSMRDEEIAVPVRRLKPY